jgi:hypothetical protein
MGWSWFGMSSAYSWRVRVSAAGIDHGRGVDAQIIGRTVETPLSELRHTVARLLADEQDQR